MKLEVKNLYKNFGDKTVFNNFSYTFKHEKITSVCGSSGCGKTTLLRILSGLDRDYRGIITPENYSVSVAFQEHRLFPGATVYENMAVADKKNISRELLLKLGIDEDSFTSLPDELSGGMARRVSLARAIVKEADVYLFDEPFGALDEASARTTAEIIKEYCSNKTCIIVTHNPTIARLFTDEFLYLD